MNRKIVVSIISSISSSTRPCLWKLALWVSLRQSSQLALSMLII